MLTGSASNSTDQLAHQVLDVLDRWDERLNGHVTQKRRHSRSHFRIRIQVVLPAGSGDPGTSRDSAGTYEAWARNLSRSGLSFISRVHLKSPRIMLCLDPDQGGRHWYHAEVVRSRQVQHEFFEYGVRFAGPVESAGP